MAIENKPDEGPYHRLSHAEHERLSTLVEELGETIQVIGKTLRHGYELHHPDRPTQTNRRELEIELGDVALAVKFMTVSGDISEDKIAEHAEAKARSRFSKYMHHNTVTQDILDAMFGPVVQGDLVEE